MGWKWCKSGQVYILKWSKRVGSYVGLKKLCKREKILKSTWPIGLKNHVRISKMRNTHDQLRWKIMQGFQSAKIYMKNFSMKSCKEKKGLESTWKLRSGYHARKRKVWNPHEKLDWISCKDEKSVNPHEN